MGNTFSSTELLPLSTMENDHEREKLEHNDKNVKQKKPPAIVLGAPSNTPLKRACYPLRLIH